MGAAMTVDNIIQFADFIAKLSPLAVALLAIALITYVFYKKMLIIGPFYNDLQARLTKTEQQRDDALDLAAKLTSILEAGRRGSYRGR